ncbi:MAG: phage terminase large subunit family protein [Anaerolineae bacterium]|jgi:hypothetical protein|nr:phage terminase large subunit family protein [Anaerolineae bacterium]
MKLLTKIQPQPDLQLATQCPTCGHYSAFTWIGEQRYPERVAKITGIDKVNLWRCEHCMTTVSNLENQA